MPLFVANEFKELVRTQTDIVPLIAESVTLQPQKGGREFVGLCPFHDDHNPSMRVYPDRQSYRCWVCDEGGDCFSFVMKRERIGFREALEMLARRANIELPRVYRAPASESGDNKNRLYEIVAWAEQEFHDCLLQSPMGERARRYLRDRGISGDSIVKFRLGYHPDSWDWLLGRAKGRYTPEQLLSVRLVGQRDGNAGYYDNFVDRVMFPIRDAQRRAVAFGGRYLPDNPQPDMPKYWNSPESNLFQKSRQLYAIDQARETIAKSETAVLVEGYTDCVVAHQHGLTNVVAALGTALNETHVMALKRFARKIVLVFDGDDAGRKATERALPKFLAHEVDLRVLTIPGGLDPADYLAAHGGPAFQALLATSVEAWELKFRLVCERYGLDSIDSRHRVLSEMLEVLSLVRPQAGAGGRLAGDWQMRENVILGRLSQLLKVTEEFARGRLHDLRVANQQKGIGQPAGQAGGHVDQTPQAATTRMFPRNPNRDESAERELLEIIFTLPDQLQKIRQEIQPADINNPYLRQLLELCLELEDQGIAPAYERVTASLEDLGLKDLAVQIDEDARDRRFTSEYTSHILSHFRRRREDRQRSAALSGPHLTSAAVENDQQSLDPETAARLRTAAELHRKRVTKSPLT